MSSLLMRLTQSALIAQAEHRDGALYLRLPSGWYRYADVDERVFLELVTAESPGRYYNNEIRGAYECARVRNPWS